MRAALDDAPLVQDLIGIADGFQAVGDHDDRLFARQLVYRLHQLFLVLGVDVRSRLIEDDYGRVLHHRAGDGQTLAFPAGERAARLADDCFIPPAEAS